jgi:hypothetical protein
MKRGMVIWAHSQDVELKVELKVSRETMENDWLE